MGQSVAMGNEYTFQNVFDGEVHFLIGVLFKYKFSTRGQILFNLYALIRSLCIFVKMGVNNL